MNASDDFQQLSRISRYSPKQSFKKLCRQSVKFSTKNHWFKWNFSDIMQNPKNSQICGVIRTFVNFDSVSVQKRVNLADKKNLKYGLLRAKDWLWYRGERTFQSLGTRVKTKQLRVHGPDVRVVLQQNAVLILGRRGNELTRLQVQKRPVLAPTPWTTNRSKTLNLPDTQL